MMKMRFEDVYEGGHITIKVNKDTSIKTYVDEPMRVEHTTGVYWTDKIEFIEE